MVHFNFEFKSYHKTINTLKDDFDLVLPVLESPVPDGLIIGSPVYFRSMSAVCKAFLERLWVLRTPKMLLADKPVGVLAVSDMEQTSGQR